MRTKLKLEKNEETFNLLGEFIPGYNRERTLSGIGLRLRTEEACREYNASINIALAKAQAEKQKLIALRKSYNMTYPSDNSKCLSTPHILFNKVKSTITEIKFNILKFCTRNNRQAIGVYRTTEQTLKASYLCNQMPYSTDLYPDFFPSYVHTLIDSLENYVTEVVDIIQIAQDLMNEEKSIRNNDELLKEIDNECRKDIEETAIALNSCKLLSNVGITKEDLEERRKNARNMSELRRLLYHNISTKEYKVRVFKDVIMRGIDNDLTPEESKVWTEQKDYNFVKHKVRQAIHIMKLHDDLPHQKMRKVDAYIIKPIYIASFIKWCHVEKSHYADFIKYLTPLFINAPFKIPSYKAIMTALNSQNTAKLTAYFGDFESFAKS